MYPFPENPRMANAVKVRIIEAFRRSGWSHHSAQAVTLSVILRYCEESEVEYRLHAWPSKGYSVEATSFMGGDPLKAIPPAGKGVGGGIAMAALDKEQRRG